MSTQQECMGIAHVSCGDCGGFHPPNWAHGEHGVPCCDLDRAAREYSRLPQSLRERLRSAHELANVDTTGKLELRQSADGSVETLWLGRLDLFAWLSQAALRGMTVHVRLEATPKATPPGPPVGTRVVLRRDMQYATMIRRKGEQAYVTRREGNQIWVQFQDGTVWQVLAREVEPPPAPASNEWDCGGCGRRIVGSLGHDRKCPVYY